MKFNIPYNKNNLFAEVLFFTDEDRDEIWLIQSTWMDERGSIILAEYDTTDGEIRMKRYKNKEEWASEELGEGHYKITSANDVAIQAIIK